jgi:hypothetical protein
MIAYRNGWVNLSQGGGVELSDFKVPGTGNPQGGMDFLQVPIYRKGGGAIPVLSCKYFRTNELIRQEPAQSGGNLIDHKAVRKTHLPPE